MNSISVDCDSGPQAWTDLKRIKVPITPASYRPDHNLEAVLYICKQEKTAEVQLTGLPKQQFDFTGHLIGQNPGVALPSKCLLTQPGYSLHR